VQEELQTVRNRGEGHVGCGNGVPITEALVNAGYRVVGLDSSAGMLALFRVNLPGTPAVRGDARRCPFTNDHFDAAISWGMLFHLPSHDQGETLASVSARRRGPQYRSSSINSNRFR
jgi:cyclopropane fatty-acyl-phospholipid synthase-like methyltransferase